MERGLRDAVDISANDSAVPDCDVGSHEDVPDDGGIGSNEDIALIEDVEVIKIHDVARTTDFLAVLPRRLKSLS